VVSFSKAALREFRATEFENPDPFCWPVYMWVWNARLTREVLSRQLKDMKAHKVGGVWPLHEPKDFRPNFMPTALEPDYLTRGFMTLHRAMVERARELHMKVWLYDEGGWPSGSVCGRIVKENPALAQQWIERQNITPKPGDVVKIPESCLSAFLYDGRKITRQLKPGTRVKISQGNIHLEIFRAARAQSANVATPPYPDLLNPRSTQDFIRMTHEKYKRCMGRYFGGVIPLVFADEPKVANPPWTDGLAADFEREYGYDIRKHLPEILDADRTKGMRCRIDFYDWWSRRFADAFFGQIQRWCRKNHLLFAGHLAGDGDKGTLGPRLFGYGHPLRMHRKFDIPGVDTVWRQIFPGRAKTIQVAWGKSVSRHPVNANHHFPKHASSVAHQEGKRWAITESFAAYGASLTPEEMKWILNFQYVRGVNLLAIGEYMLSTRDHFMGSLRPFMGRMNPMWQHMDGFHAYAARLSYLLSLGKPVVETAVYYPIRDIWAGGPDVQKVVNSHDDLVRALLENQCDFDLVDDDVLDRASTKVANGRLEVGPMRYHTVCVSRSKWMSRKAKEKLLEFASNGGKVLWVDNVTGSRRPRGSMVASFRELVSCIKPLVQIRPRNAAIRVCKRSFSNGSLYLVTNEGQGAATCVAAFNESLPAYRLDPETGDCYSVRGAAYSTGKCRLGFHLPFAGSCLVLFTAENIQVKAARAEAGKNVILLGKGWTCRRVKSCRIGQHDFEVEKVNEQVISTKLGDWRGKLGEEFSGEVEYRASFACSAAQAADARVLDLGEVLYGCEVVLNGRNLGKRSWRPFAFGVRDLLKEGRNDLRVIVANTISNQYATTKILDQWPDNIVGPYHKICVQFEKDNLPSGLYGPVKILS